MGCVESVMRSTGDISQVLLMIFDLWVHAHAPLIAQCPIEGRTPNSKRLCDGRQPDALLSLTERTRPENIHGEIPLNREPIALSSLASNKAIGFRSSALIWSPIIFLSSLVINSSIIRFMTATVPLSLIPCVPQLSYEEINHSNTAIRAAARQAVVKQVQYAKLCYGSQIHSE
jgi:hypothetical protein